MLPRPPITTTANASTTSSTGMSSEAAAVGTTSAPPTVPSTVPSVKTLAYIQRTFTPSASAHLAVLGGGAQDAAEARALQERADAGGDARCSATITSTL